MYRYCVRPSVCPMMCPQKENGFVAACRPGGQDILIDSCTDGAQQQQRRANAGSATLSAYVRS